MTPDETEAQRGAASCPMSLSLKVEELGFGSGLLCMAHSRCLMSLVSFCILCGWGCSCPCPRHSSRKALGGDYLATPFFLRGVGGRRRPSPNPHLVPDLGKPLVNAASFYPGSSLPSTHFQAFASSVLHAQDTLPTILRSFLGDTCCSWDQVKACLTSCLCPST